MTAKTDLDRKIEAVRQLTSLGFQVLLTHGLYQGACTCGNVECKKVAKHPLMPNGVYSATTDADWIAELLKSQPHANIAVATGPESGILDLDLDSAEAIEAATKLGLPKTVMFRSGRPEIGQHCWFKYPELRTGLYIVNDVEVGTKMDIRSKGGYCIVPCSIHESGKPYEYLPGCAPWEVDIADRPDWLYDLLIIKHDSTTEVFSEDTGEMYEEGGRNDYLFKFGCSIWTKEVTVNELQMLLTERNAVRCHPPLESHEVIDIVRSISERYNQGVTGPRATAAKAIEAKIGSMLDLPEILLTAPLTDSGNAECLVELFGGEFRSSKQIATLVTQSKGIMVWSGHVWMEDVYRQFRDRAKWTMRGRGRVAEQAESKEARAALYRHATSSENLAKLEAMCELASTDERMVVPEDQWDADPLKLAVLNGVIDLRTGTFIKPDKEDYITQYANVMYDPEAQCPLWIKTLGEIFEDQPEVVPYLRRVIGYCLTGLTDEHVMWFWYGKGGNGKSTIINIMQAMLGMLSKATSFATFDEREENARNDDIAVLRGKRFVYCTEGSRNRKIAEHKIKSIVSNDEIRCRFLHANFFTLKPTFKIVYASNNLPDIHGTDIGIWRRVHVLQFNQEFPEGGRRDKGLEAKLKRELAGIFNWSIGGLQDYLEIGGFDPPAVVINTVKELRESNDAFQQWFDEQLVPETGSAVEWSETYTSYRSWMKSQGGEFLNKASWTRALKERGVEFEVKKGSKSYADGWRISAD